MWEQIVQFFTADGFTYELLLAFLPLIPLLHPRKYGALRIVSSVLAIILISCLTFRYVVGENRFISCLWYLGIAVLTVFAVWLCFEGGFWNALFLTMSAYVIQHILFQTTELEEFLLHFCGVEEGNWLYYFCYFLGMGAIFCAAWAVFTRRIAKEKNFKANNVKLLASTALIIVALIILNLYTQRELEAQDAVYTSLYLFHIVLGLVCGYVLLDSLFSNVYNKKLEEDIRIIQLLWQNDRRQYEMFRQNMETMSIKYHDLKHQLGLLSAAQLSEGDSRWLSEAIASLNVLGKMQKTGNETLDVVLVQKHMKCEAEDIELVTIVDGSLLQMMDDVDVYSLFGNALDNAIECVENIPDKEKRTVTLTVRRVGGMVKIQVENYTPAQVQFVDGLPQTTKQDKLTHGYGVKSIAYIVKKYGGIATFELSDNTFILDAMIPLQKC